MLKNFRANVLKLFSKTTSVPVTYLPVSSPVSHKFAFGALVLRVYYAVGISV